MGISVRVFKRHEVVAFKQRLHSAFFNSVSGYLPHDRLLDKPPGRVYRNDTAQPVAFLRFETRIYYFRSSVLFRDLPPDGISSSLFEICPEIRRIKPDQSCGRVHGRKLCSEKVQPRAHSRQFRQLGKLSFQQYVLSVFCGRKIAFLSHIPVRLGKKVEKAPFVVYAQFCKLLKSLFSYSFKFSQFHIASSAPCRVQDI